MGVIQYDDMYSTSCFELMRKVCAPQIKHRIPEETFMQIQNNPQICAIHHYAEKFQTDNI